MIFVKPCIQIVEMTMKNEHPNDDTERYEHDEHQFLIEIINDTDGKTNNIESVLCLGIYYSRKPWT